MCIRDSFNKATAKQYPGYEDHFIADQEYALVGDHIEDIDVYKRQPIAAA